VSLTDDDGGNSPITGSALFTGTLATFAAARTSYANGLATTWTPATNGDSSVAPQRYLAACRRMSTSDRGDVLSR
jgi:hypothetical protein